MIRSLLITALLAIVVLPAFAQLNTGSNEFPSPKAGTLANYYLEELSNTTTIFIYDDQLAPQLEDYKLAFKNSWNYTEVKFVHEDQATPYSSAEGYSFVDFNTHTYAKETRRYLCLWLNNTEKKKARKRVYFRIELSPDYSAKGVTGRKYFNLSPGQLQTYLKLANTNLTQEKERSLFESASNSDLVNLKTDTLLVANTILKVYNGKTGLQGKTWTAEKLFESYRFPYKLISPEELDAKIMAGDKLYYLVYVQSSVDKFLTVHNSETGNTPYSYAGVSPLLKPADLTRLSLRVKIAH